MLSNLIIIEMLIYEIIIPITIVKYGLNFKQTEITNVEEAKNSKENNDKDRSDIQPQNKHTIAVVTEWLPNNTEEPTSAWVFCNLSFWINENDTNIVPLLPWYSNKKVKEILNTVDGVVFMGGMRDLYPSGKFEKYGKFILNYSKAKKIPILAICQGFQLLLTLESNTKILSKFNNIPSRYQSDHFTEETLESIKKDKLFTHFTSEDIRSFKEKNVNLHYHMYGVNEEVFKTHKELTDNYNISTLGRDRDEVQFINSVYHKKYPIHAVQYHPEVGNYTFKNSQLNRSEEELPLSKHISSLIFNGFKEEMKTRTNQKRIKSNVRLNYLQVDESKLVFNEFYKLKGFKIERN